MIKKHKMSNKIMSRSKILVSIASFSASSALSKHTHDEINEIVQEMSALTQTSVSLD